jgi:cell division initiation protein
MELTPDDVEQKAFTQALRGYQMDEVDDFLDEIVTTIRAYDQRLRDAQEKIRALEAEAASRGGDETTISRAILVAQRSADSLLAEAKAEAVKIKEVAKAETEVLTAERDRERIHLQGQVDGMRDRVSGLRESLTTLASAIAGQVGEMESEIADAEGNLQPDSTSGVDTVDLEPAAASGDESDLAATVDGDDDADGPDDDGTGSPQVLDSSDADDDEDQNSRVSARPWERG